mmetsp:Transcript_86415/g.270382  ORF Transcript_86415/g.270382 Transcript_86415/m.270382 type:complete len:227 (+) Transcript_86415:342-1022(+)
MLGIVKVLQPRGLRDLQERHGGRQHPAKPPAEERIVPQRHDVLYLPEDRSAVPVVVVAERYVLHDRRAARLGPAEGVVSVLVEVRLVPLAVLVECAVLAHGMRKVPDHDHAPVLGEDQAFHETSATVLSRGVQVDVVSSLGKLEALLGLGPPEVDEGALRVEGVVAEADVGRAGNDSQLGQHQHAEGAVGPEERLEEVLPLIPAAPHHGTTGEHDLQLEAELLEQP